MMPVDGGLYAQHPELVDKFWIIMQAQAKHDSDKNSPTKGAKAPARSSSPKRRGRR